MGPGTGFSPLPGISARPKYKRRGFASASYLAGILLDSMMVFIISYILSCVFMYALPATNVVVDLVAFLFLQTIGHLAFWIWLALSFGYHQVRRWWFHLLLHLWFALVFQAAFFLPYVPRLEDALLNAEIAPYLWFAWALCAPLIVKSIGLGLTMHDAMRVHYPAAEGSKACWAKEERLYFQANSARLVYEALETGNLAEFKRLEVPSPKHQPGIFRSFAVLTFSTHPTAPEQFPAYLHLKDVWFSGHPLLYRAIHRCPGFSRIHHLKLEAIEYEFVKWIFNSLNNRESTKAI